MNGNREHVLKAYDESLKRIGWTRLTCTFPNGARQAHTFML